MENRMLRLASRAAMADEVRVMESILEVAVPTGLVEPRSESTTTSSSSSSTCTSNSEKDSCAKPVSSSSFTLPIVLGVVIPVIGALILFFILHRRHVRKQLLEDLNDRHASMDFGLGDVPQLGRYKKDQAGFATAEMGMNEKSVHRRQISMDMTIENPYLVPPGLQGSRESLKSLSKSIHQHGDPYRPVTQHLPGDACSTRSASRNGHDNSSIHTSSSRAPSRNHGFSGVENYGPLSHNSLANAHAPLQTSIFSLTKPTSTIEGAEKSIPTTNPIQPPEVHLARTSSPAPVEIRGLPACLQPMRHAAPTSSLVKHDSSSSNAAAFRQSNNHLGALINFRDKTPTPPPETTSSPSRIRKSPPPIKSSLPADPRPPRTDSIPVIEKDERVFADSFQITPPSPGPETEFVVPRAQRHSLDGSSGEHGAKGLVAPQRDSRRISMGLRPLPPHVVTEVDDPEIRANRIRSFYKEYFDESKPAPQGYYEDIDENYFENAGYSDSGHYNSVTRYGQPRRAMTPPPLGPRLAGPPRANNRSIGAMSIGGGCGPQMYPIKPYPPGQRPFSSASGRRPGGHSAQKKQLPPPPSLNTIPTPSKLKDDSFSLMGAVDFAPPQTFRDRAAGRSESPLGERRPYSPSVPSFTPTVSAFDELAVMPSPHSLRRSGTFTALDFAPPKKFKHANTMSDAGSIRSNRSGVSAMHNQAIRDGAYRVSRIPQDVVFARDDLATTLKPQWDMRGPTSSVRDY